MSHSSSIAATLAALAKLHTDTEELYVALVKHEKMLAPGHQNDPGIAELYAMVHRFRNLLRELSATLAEQAPSAAR
jgi:hypothetical protein